jgi:hypothetical protein
LIVQFKLNKGGGRAIKLGESTARGTRFRRNFNHRWTGLTQMEMKNESIRDESGSPSGGILGNHPLHLRSSCSPANWSS